MTLFCSPGITGFCTPSKASSIRTNTMFGLFLFSCLASSATPAVYLHLSTRSPGEYHHRLLFTEMRRREFLRSRVLGLLLWRGVFLFCLSASLVTWKRPSTHGTRLPHEDAAASLTFALHRPVLGPSDYPGGPPHERSTSFRRRRVGAASTPWSPKRDRRDRRAPSPMRSS